MRHNNLRPMNSHRYARQVLLPQVGHAGQQRLGASRVLLVGCGALGTHLAEHLVRAGVGLVRLVDRDVVETSNLQRQALFDERHARDGAAKALAAAERLAAVNSEVRIEPHVADFAPDNARELADGCDLLLDGTDNVATRYLLNDLAVSTHRPWVYGACVGVEGRVMAIDPRPPRNPEADARSDAAPCLRCVFPDPPAPGELPTCDTAGVLGPVAAIVAGLQAVAAIQLLLGDRAPVGLMRTVDGWKAAVRTIDFSTARRDDCLCCRRQRFEFLDASPHTGAVLCGRQAVQVRPVRPVGFDFDALAARLSTAGLLVRRTPAFVRVDAVGAGGESITVFTDGRAIVQGTSDLGRAQALYGRIVGG